jgi:hypothetical protein
MIVELFMAAMARRKRQTVEVLRPDGWNPEMIAPYCATRPQAPWNNPAPGPLNKVLETVPAGERREVFALTGPGTFQIFQNKAAISVEINEIFLFGVVAGSVTILQDEQAQTPVIPIAVNQMYSDSGFRLAVDGRVNLLLTGATQVSGFLRWRYT